MNIRKFLWENSLSLAMFLLFAIFLVAQSIAGNFEHNEELAAHGQATLTYFQYLGNGHFIEAVFENWESEFLQMGVFVFFAAFLRQKGSAESKKLVGEEEVDQTPRQSRSKNAPWPLRVGGFALTLYKNSLSLVFLLLFFLSFYLHAVGGTKDYNQEQLIHQQPPVTLQEYVQTSRFWFESFQNWQSEFLALGAMVVLSIYLRQQGSPQSKPVSAPHDETGN